jgi:hypothetical protein
VRLLPSPDSGEIPGEPDGAELVEDGPVVTPPAPTRPKAQKKIRTPNLDNELHPGEHPSFKAYAEPRNVTGASPVLTKFLIVASWLHEERAENHRRSRLHMLSLHRMAVQ